MIEEAKICEIDYVNHRGERALRRVLPLRFYFAPTGTTLHPGPGWFLEALDLRKGLVRDFAIVDCTFQRPEPPPVALCEDGTAYAVGPPLTEADALDWMRTEAHARDRELARELADREGEAVYYFPEGIAGPHAEGSRGPCWLTESQTSPGERSKGERIEPTKEQV
jgi:hypothetical protein